MVVVALVVFLHLVIRNVNTRGDERSQISIRKLISKLLFEPFDVTGNRGRSFSIAGRILIRIDADILSGGRVPELFSNFVRHVSFGGKETQTQSFLSE